MTETKNYHLYIEGDNSVTFKTWREKMNGLSDSNMQKIDEALSMKADQSKAVSATLSYQSWSNEVSPYTQTIKVVGLTTDSNGSISVANSATNEQRNSARNAMLSIINQQPGSLTIAADGEKPTTDIPVTIILLS